MSEFLFNTAKTFADQAVRVAFNKANEFHDAFIESATLEGTRLTLNVLDPYFPEREQYNQFGLKGATLVLEITPPKNMPDFTAFLKDPARDIYWLRYDLETRNFVIMAQEIYNCDFEFNPEASTFAWLHM